MLYLELKPVDENYCEKLAAPELESAKIAICWVNWDIDPGKFSV